MEGKEILHITNGDGLYQKVLSLKLPGDHIVWREILCEGPSSLEVGDEEFIRIREKFLQENYNISPEDYKAKFISELEKLSVINNYDEIVLWFEFDLFSHMNMLALISFLVQNKKNDQLSLVCSRKLEGEEEMSPLSELSLKNLKQHFDYRISLTENDISTALHTWELYCGNKHKRLTSEIKKSSNFEYLASSIRAHLERFPNAKTGFNSLEINVLKLIKKHEVKSLNHLLGYALKYQGYYGYVDIQMEKVIEKVRPFFDVKPDELVLNEDGENVLKGFKNYYQKMKSEEFYGGARKYDFLYDPDSHDLLKL